MESVMLENPILLVGCIGCILLNLFSCLWKGKGILLPVIAGASCLLCTFFLILGGVGKTELACVLTVLFLISLSSYKNRGNKK